MSPFFFIAPRVVSNAAFRTLRRTLPTKNIPFRAYLSSRSPQSFSVRHGIPQQHPLDAADHSNINLIKPQWSNDSVLLLPRSTSGGFVQNRQFQKNTAFVWP
tara:strand:- start:62 stop:367 length:306 start_codon:yes stop_codon:yes gene_type:complete